MSAYSGNNRRLRQLRREPLFEENLKTIIPGARRADEFLEGAEWLLARDPATCGRQIRPASGVWRMVWNEMANVSPFVLYYVFDDNCVCLLAIEVTDEEDPWANE